MRPVAVLLLLPLALAFPCPQGWRYNDYNDLCFLFFYNATDYISAEQNCVSFGGHLADIHDGIQNSIILGAGAEYNTMQWIGLNYLMSSDWAWTTGAPVNYTNWVDGAPNIPSYDQCVAQSNYDFMWRQVGCEDKLEYVCQMATKNYTHSTPTPLRCPGDIYCTPGYTLFEGNNLCYKYNITPATPEENIATCHAEGATLVKIDSAELNEFLLNLSKGPAPLIGLSCSSNSTADCYWFDGTPLTGYTNFFPGEPGGEDGGGNKTFISTGVHPGTWVTAPYDYGYESLLCQKDSITAPEYMEALNSQSIADQNLKEVADLHGLRKSRM